MSTFERRCVTKNEPTGSVEVAVVDEEAVGEVLVEVEEGREVEGEESDRRESMCSLGSCAMRWASFIQTSVQFW